MKKMKVLFWICVALHVFICQNQYGQVFADQFAVQMDIDEVEAMKVADELGLIFVGEVIIHNNCSFNVVNLLTYFKSFHSHYQLNSDLIVSSFFEKIKEETEKTATVNLIQSLTTRGHGVPVAPPPPS